jgi:hypothetical protein
MDIGIEEKTENLGSLILQHLKRINGTRCTADVEEYFQESTSFVAKRPLVAPGIISHNPYSGKLREGKHLRFKIADW